MIDRPREFEEFLEVLDRAWDSLKALATAEFPEIQLERGAEVMLDLPRPDLSDARVRLAGTSFVLLEFPFMSIPPHSALAIRDLARNGWVPVIAHPERYRNIPVNYDLVEEWRDSGACIQVNSGSLVGYYGAEPKAIAWELVGRGCVDYLSSDYHSRGKCAIGDCGKAFERRGAATQHRTLTTTNPERLLRNERPVPVQPLVGRAGSLWRRLLPWFLR
jgi:protein-tyrosine phosphatase